MSLELFLVELELIDLSLLLTSSANSAALQVPFEAEPARVFAVVAQPFLILATSVLSAILGALVEAAHARALVVALHLSLRLQVWKLLLNC